MRLTVPVSFAALGLLAPSVYSHGHPSSLTDWEQIHQVINLYAVAVDFNQTHELFPLIFAPDAFANYSSDEGSRSDLHGLKNITDAFAPDGAKFGAQHLFGSITIDIDDEKKKNNNNKKSNNNSTIKANSTSYALTTAFGRRTHAGKQVQFYGVYRDTFELIEGLGWRIKTRYYSMQGPPFGDTSVLEG